MEQLSGTRTEERRDNDGDNDEVKKRGGVERMTLLGEGQWE